MWLRSESLAWQPAPCRRMSCRVSTMQVAPELRLGPVLAACRRGRSWPPRAASWWVWRREDARPACCSSREPCLALPTGACSAMRWDTRKTNPCCGGTRCLARSRWDIPSIQNSLRALWRKGLNARLQACRPLPDSYTGLTVPPRYFGVAFSASLGDQGLRHGGRWM